MSKKSRSGSESIKQQQCMCALEREQRDDKEKERAPPQNTTVLLPLPLPIPFPFPPFPFPLPFPLSARAPPLTKKREKMPISTTTPLFSGAILIHERCKLDEYAAFSTIGSINGEEVSFAANIATEDVFAAANATDADGCAVYRGIVTFFNEGRPSTGFAQQATAKLLALSFVASMRDTLRDRARLGLWEILLANAEMRIADLEANAPK